MARRLMSDSLLSQLDLRDLPVQGQVRSSSPWVPWPTIRPSSTTRMRSASQDRADPLGHQDDGGLPHALLQILAQGLVGFHVQGGEAVVKDVDLWALYQSPGAMAMR